MKITFCLSLRLAKSGSAASATLRWSTAVVEKLGLVAHLLDDVVRRVALGARNSQVEPVGAIMAEIVHGAVERGPVLLLLTRQIELGLDPIDVRVAVGDNLLARQLRLAGLG